MSLYAPIAIAMIFALWALYRLFIKRDLMKHKDVISFFVFLMSVWAVIYIALII